MQSFRTELEWIEGQTKKVLVEKDLADLADKIYAFRNGTIPEEKFKSLRLARGIYGQRQQGVQMIRIKLPFGRVSPKQLLKIADVSDEYSTGKVHLTTRQDIQIHHVSLDRTPELWAKLEEDDITLREACGNTVRNVTASPEAGIDPKELFDVSPYAQAVFAYFLRQPFCQELGRKIKIAFSHTEEDSAFTYIHDLGFIPKIQNGAKGFKVLVAGGLGAQPILAQVAYEFLPEQYIIPFVEGVLRVFDRYGERANRHKARLKYLVAKIGLEAFLDLVKQETPAVLADQSLIDTSNLSTRIPDVNKVYTSLKPTDALAFDLWKKANTFSQKQSGFVGVYVKVKLGDLSTSVLRELAHIAESYAADDIRITINQGFLLRFVPVQALGLLYQALKKIHLADPGFNAVNDVTACPGTDTCNLAISNSTHIALALEELVEREFPELILNKDISIKISGCMNSCGQHGLAAIGFHGSSFKQGNQVVPALQLLLGGATLGDGAGRSGDKIIKVASKRGPALLRNLLSDYLAYRLENEPFYAYYDRKGKDYFYQLLKPLADNTSLGPEDLLDWGSEEKFQTAIGVGECAGVSIDLVATLFLEAEEKRNKAREAYEAKRPGDAVYFAYATFVHAAKALLLDKQVHVNTQIGVLKDFDTHFGSFPPFKERMPFTEHVLRIQHQKPDMPFAEDYIRSASDFLEEVRRYRALKEEEKQVTSPV